MRTVERLREVLGGPSEWLALLDALAIPYAVADQSGSVVVRSPLLDVGRVPEGAGTLIAAAARTLAASLDAEPEALRILRSHEGARALGLVIATSPLRLLVVPTRNGPAAGEVLPDGFSGLTSREREVALLLASPLSTYEIAARLGITRHTTRRHTEAVFRKLRVRSRVAAAEVVRLLYRASPSATLQIERVPA
jgi:DNA-binding CsgD family transcriptional regulator